MKITKQRRVMHMAHIIYKNDRLNALVAGNRMPDWSEAVANAWRIQDVRAAMYTGIVRLYYTKKDGTDVMRHGTLSSFRIPGKAMPKGIQDQLIENDAAVPTWGVVSYYDLDAQGWRSFQIENLNKAVPVADVSTPVYHVIGSRLY